ncbi:ketopantoate hydroxymethyltransferase [Nitrospirillum amazonense]|uniref:3-methyl-2-oxobutanoate hydroxymethyltransferase n=1 Tax=Nitrospirillum amazonense TaxID=28077 RepID=A0A560ERB2_9PROT|nr:3-methyl-2-oxobutanoate hydroxymethyltransferase [Nitrospirillum amazonense]TWB11913.1 ketopantoate hydroxymethyltransferase [Nitrospirillum amazonense]
MSATTAVKRLSVPDISARKGTTPVVCLTAYTAPMAGLLDPHCDVLLVGDSLGMVLYGLPSTLGVTVDMMVAHGAAVVRGSNHAAVVVDLPFGSYQESREQAFRVAARILAETGAAAVKLEGGEEMAATIDFLVRRGIPVMGHVGLTPQAVNVLGGYRARGRSDAEQAKILGDARAVAEAGAFSLVIEGVVEPLARQVTELVPVITIGIGASAACDGQVLVSDDMLGLFADFTPKFVRRYADLAGQVSAAAQAYAEDVRARRFPGPEHTFAEKRPKA